MNFSLFPKKCLSCGRFYFRSAERSHSICVGCGAFKSLYETGSFGPSYHLMTPKMAIIIKRLVLLGILDEKKHNQVLENHRRAVAYLDGVSEWTFQTYRESLLLACSARSEEDDRKFWDGLKTEGEKQELRQRLSGKWRGLD